KFPGPRSARLAHFGCCNKKETRRRRTQTRELRRDARKSRETDSFPGTLPRPLASCKTKVASGNEPAGLCEQLGRVCRPFRRKRSCPTFKVTVKCFATGWLFERRAFAPAP